MSLIFSISGFEIVAMVLLFFTLITVSVEKIIQIIHVLIVFFIIKNIIQEVIIGMIKNKNNFFLTLWYLLTDVVQIFLFFNLLTKAALDYRGSGGLEAIESLFEFLFVFFIAGGVYLCGELGSGLRCTEYREEYPVLLAFSNVPAIILLALLNLFCAY